MHIPKEYQTEAILKFKDRSYFKGKVNIFFGILMIDIATAIFIGLKDQAFIWLVDAGVILSFVVLLYVFESLAIAITANIIAALAVAISFYNAIVLGESWSAFLFNLSLELNFFCLMCFIFIHNALK